MTKHKNHMFKCLCPPKYGGSLCEGASKTCKLKQPFSFVRAIQTTFRGLNFLRQKKFFGRQFKGL